jgi:hypothetical protein
MKNRFRTKIVAALALTCATGLTTAVPVHAAVPLAGEEAYIELAGDSADPSTWTWTASTPDSPAARSIAAGSCTATVTPVPPSIAVACTFPLVSACLETDVAVWVNGPGTLTGSNQTCMPFPAAVTVTGPRGYGTSTAPAVAPPAPKCTATVVGGAPAPWRVRCHWVFVRV